MKLLTPEIIRALPSLYTTEAVRLQDKIVICKFFTPWTNWTWFVFEGEKQADGDYLFFEWCMVSKRNVEIFYFLN